VVQPKIALVLGTRPEIIKMCPVIRELERRNVDFFIIHSNQHYSEKLDRVFFEELELAPPKYNLGIGSAEHGNQTGRMLIAIEEILLAEKPTCVLAQGDTNTVLAGILAATKQDIRCGHVEAGLRSYDRTMPEEKNRVVCDSVADDLFCPTGVQRDILLGEGVPEERLHVTGNTIVDAVLQNRELAKGSDVLQRFNLEPGRYSLVTAHRASNTDHPDALRKLVEVIAHVAKITGRPTLYPVHPRTQARLQSFGLTIDGAILVEPVGYRDFLALQANAHLIVTDSGGVQEEACILGVPCVTIRENTERPETVDVGANRLVGVDIERLEQAYAYFTTNAPSWENPLGDGHAAERIVEVACRS
jgi:UDP-N-acetylglucosamine 2-epimerase (non-hydrolysing)